MTDVGARMESRWRLTRPSRVLLPLGVVAAVVLSAAACGSSSSAKAPASTTPTSTTPTSTAPSSTASSTGSSALTAAAAAIAAAKVFPTNISVTTPLTSAPPTGKTVVFLQCEEVQCGLQGQGISAAASLLGWHYKQLNFNDTNPATLVSALNEALQYHPVAVMFAGQPEAVWKGVLPAYKKAGALIIPDAPGFDAVVGPQVPGITQGNDWQGVTGKLMADFVAVDSGGKANILFETVPTYSTFIPTSNEFNTELKSVCPACTVSTLSNTIPDLFGGKIDASVVSKLKTSSNINYVVSVDGAFITGLTSALQTAGLAGKYKIVSGSGGPANMQNVKSGAEAATVVEGFKYTGWLSVDVALRSMQGLPVPSGDTVGNPQYVITQDNVPTPTDSLDLPSDYASQFKTLWKVG